MDATLSRAGIVKANDPHDWNTYDHYVSIHEKRLAEHPLVDWSIPNTLSFDSTEAEGVLHLTQAGKVYCHGGVTLDIEKWFETRRKSGRLQIRGVLYRYVAWIASGNLVVKYHNLHEKRDEYTHRAYDPVTGRELLYETLTRNQFPVLTEVLDEIGVLTT